MKIAVVANSAWYLYNFRRSLIRELYEAGHVVHGLSPAGAYANKLAHEGFAHVEIELAASGTNVFMELWSLLRLGARLRLGRYDVALTYTPKVNIYTGLVARAIGLAHIPNVSGLGRTFIHRSWLTTLVKRLYAQAFLRAHVIVFQNDDDRLEFLRLGLVDAGRTCRVPGSGVDLKQFEPVPLPTRSTSAPVFLFIGRVLGDKGMNEFADAARIVRNRYPGADFRVLGALDADNPSAISRELFERWTHEKVLTYLGTTDDVREAIGQADCVVLPSYREGVPRSLLEASAMGRPCIATDVPGCRDVVEHGKTGLLCEARSASSLSAAFLQFIDTPVERRAEMGRQARLKVENQFSERVVIDTYVRLVDSLETAVKRTSRIPQ